MGRFVAEIGKPTELPDCWEKPPKNNMEPEKSENHLFEKENHLNQTSIFGYPVVSFRGFSSFSKSMVPNLEETPTGFVGFKRLLSKNPKPKKKHPSFSIGYLEPK